MDISEVKLVEIPRYSDSRGTLRVFESTDTTKFSIDRVFYVMNVPPGTVRGEHANRDGDEMIIALNGHFTVRVKDGNRSEDFLLNSPDVGLFLPKMIWCELFQFTPDAICLVMAEGNYDSDRQISDFDAYVVTVRNQ